VLEALKIDTLEIRKVMVKSITAVNIYSLCSDRQRTGKSMQSKAAPVLH